VLRLLPAAGVRVSTLAAALPDAVEGDVDLPAGSWGAGKDFRIWAGPAVADVVAENERVQRRLLATVRASVTPRARSHALDQLAREALLLLSSDWAFMVSRDSAADYARGRVKTHAERFDRLADAVDAGREVVQLAASLRTVDGPFGSLDGRLLHTDG
jgi:1,4-alpha-glucan branching enzyme